MMVDEPLTLSQTVVGVGGVQSIRTPCPGCGEKRIGDTFWASSITHARDWAG